MISKLICTLFGHAPLTTAGWKGGVGYGHIGAASIGEGGEANGGQTMTALDSTRSAAVDHGYHWQPMATCPKGSKVQLLTRYGCAIYGTWTGKETIYAGRAPLPTRAPEATA